MADSYQTNEREPSLKPDAPEVSIKPKGKFFDKLSDLWDRYKWVVIIGGFFLIVLVVGIVQMSTKDEYDQSVVFAGPEMLTPNQSKQVGAALSELLPRDYSGDDKLLIKFQGYGVYDEDEMKEANEEETLPNGQYNVVVTPSSNSSATLQYKDYMMSGECAIYFISRSQYENLSSQGRICSMESIFGEKLPEGMLPDGYGVALSELDLYSLPALKLLPEDTVICFSKQTVMGKCSDDDYYESAREYFKALVEYKAS